MGRGSVKPGGTDERLEDDPCRDPFLTKTLYYRGLNLCQYYGSLIHWPKHSCQYHFEVFFEDVCGT